MQRVGVVGSWIGAFLVLGCEFVPRETTEAAAGASASSAPSAPSAAGHSAPVTPPPRASVEPERRPAIVPPKLLLAPGAEAAGLALNQLRMVAADPWVKTKALHEVTVYVVFSKPFAGHLDLRAQAADGSELGRSEREAPRSEPGDSARYLSFRFDARMPLANVAAFVAHVDPLPEVPPPPPKNVASMKPTPKPQPEPQFLRPPGPDLVPKNP